VALARDRYPAQLTSEYPWYGHPIMYRRMLLIIALALATMVTGAAQVCVAADDAGANATSKRELAESLVKQGKLFAAVTPAEEAVRLSAGRDPAAMFLLGSIYYQLGRLPDAEQVLDALVRLHPDAQAGLLLQGIVKLDFGNVDDAEAALRKAAERDPSSLWARLGLALVERARGRLAEAETALERLSADKPDWSVAQFQLGLTRLQRKDVAGALKAFDAAERATAHADDARLLTARALVAAQQPGPAIERARTLLKSSVAPQARALIVQAEIGRGAPAKAEQVLREAVDASPQDTVARLQLARFYMERGRAREALGQFERAARASPDAPEPLAGQADAHLALGEPSEAVKAAERLVAVRPDNAESYLALALVFERLGRSDDAVATYRKLLEKWPDHLGAVRGMAALAAREGRTADAVKLLVEAARAHPRTTVPFVDIAQIAERAGNPSVAIAAYRDALVRTPDDPMIMNNLAVLLAKESTTRAEAASLAERAYRKRPANGAIADTLGWILYQQQSFDRAAPLLEQAARTLPGEPQVRYHLAALYAEQGKRAEARQELEHALKGPRFPESAEAQKLLETLR
jgi:cellulose synthase operon protein C